MDEYEKYALGLTVCQVMPDRKIYSDLIEALKLNSLNLILSRSLWYVFNLYKNSFNLKRLNIISLYILYILFLSQIT